MTKNDFKTFNLLVLLIILLGIATAIKSIPLHSPYIRMQDKVPEVSPTPVPLSYVPQFVLISFDGSKSVDIWKDIREFKGEMKAVNKPLNVSHFMNAAYLLTDETKNSYSGPGKAPGQTNIGIADGVEDLRTRINEVNAALADGDEVVSHTVGHFSGLGWTKGQWEQEFNSYGRIISNLDAMYPDAHLPKLNFSQKDFTGFRAPYLDRSSGLYEALHEIHARYDSSEIGVGNAWPTKDGEGMWHIPLGTLSIGPAHKSVLAMDYNLYVYHSQAKDLLKKGSPEWKTAYDETLAGFLDYFNKNYSSNRAPVLMGYHFSMKWNDGVYWEVMKDFARQVCGKPEVRCGAFHELVDYMDKFGVPNTTKKMLTAGAGDIDVGVNLEAAVGHEDGEEL